MLKILIYPIIILSTFFNAVGFAQSPVCDKHKQQPEVAKLLQEVVPKLRAEKNLVGLGAMVMVDGQVIGSAVHGKRQKVSDVDLTVNDGWHLGSITKSITATMIARLVERKQLKWSSKVGEYFNESGEIHTDWKEVTLEQLLTHTSGAPPNFSLLFLLNRRPEREKRLADRLEAVLHVMAQKPLSEPGTTFVYSNVGFTIAAVIAEKQTGMSWEDLIRQEIFKPLKLTNAGFGPPQDGEKPFSQPRGHATMGWLKIPVGSKDDNTPIMAPAGAISMTLEELCAYGNLHLQGEKRSRGFLTTTAFKQLHTPRLKKYGMGWVNDKESKWTNGPLLWHNGSNTMWYALLVLLPDKNSVLAITSNDGDVSNAQSAAIQIVKAVSEALDSTPIAPTQPSRTCQTKVVRVKCVPKPRCRFGR